LAAGVPFCGRQPVAEGVAAIEALTRMDAFDFEPHY